MKNQLLPIFILSIWVASVSCSPEGEQAPLEPNLRTLEIHETKTVNASTEFAIDLFHQLNKSGRINQFYSPYSIHMALSMTMNGNEGEVFEEFLNFLRFEDQTRDEANKGAKELTEFLLEVDPRVQLAITNAIWYRQDYQVQAAFKKLSEQFYNAEVAGIDVADPKSVRIINDWIENQTKGRIKDMLDQVPADAVMYLVNAIYYKADWRYPFDAAKTAKEAFHTSAHQHVSVDMMTLKEAAPIRIFQNDVFQYIDIPYSTGQYSMGILLPHDYDLSVVEDHLTSDNLSLWRSQAVEQNINLKMPKFKLKQKIENLRDDLIEMGLESPFFATDKNFTLLFENPTDPLEISRVIHDAVIEVDEKGTEAAAATVVEIRELSAMPSGPKTVVIDRPFIFFIQEKHSGAILFLGRLGDPSAL